MRDRVRGFWEFGAAISISAAVVLATFGTLSCVSAPSGTADATETAVGLGELELRLMAGVVDTIISGQRDSATVCLDVMADVRGRRPSSVPLVGYLLSRRDVTTSGGCPRTYARMIQPVDSLGRPFPDDRPEGHVNPYRLEVSRPQFDGSDLAWISVIESHELSGTAFLCRTREQPAGLWVDCRITYRWIS